VGHEAVHVALHEQRAALRLDRGARQVGPVEEVALRVERRLGRVQVLGRLVTEGAPAEGDDAPLEVIDTAGRGFEEETPEASESKANEGEASLAAAEVERIVATGVAPADIAVIAPYDAQVQRLRQVLASRLDQGVEIDTVDGFQGREKEAVVVTLVRSNEEGDVGFLADIRRMNVALTRARKKLVVIGDSATVCRHPFYEGFFREAEKNGAWRSAWDRC